MKPIPADNLGVSSGLPFAMAFLFTKDGTKVYTGSLDRIRAKTNDDPPCHGIVHTYGLNDTTKMWSVFGNTRYELSYIRCKQSDFMFYRDIIGLKQGKHNIWALIDPVDRRLIRKWRRLPSQYLINLDGSPPRMPKSRWGF